MSGRPDNRSGDAFEVLSPVGRAADTSGPTATDRSDRLDEIVCRGSYAEITAFFETRLWTDGLPIVPPTRAAVERMLGGCRRAGAEVLGVVGDERIEATVWNAAVNAVMAGCRAHDFPIIVAVAEAMADPAFRVRDGGSTTGWEVLVIISGPDLPGRGFVVGTGVMRLGARPNSSIGRFTRLWIRNIVGLRTPPGLTDMAAIGQSFFVAMAEDDDARRRIGWPSCREEWGYEPDDLVVAVQGMVGVSAPIYSAGPDWRTHLDFIARAVGGCSGHFAGLGARTGQWDPVLAMCPAIAEVFARGGKTPEQVRRGLAKAAVAPARLLSDGLVGLGQRPLELRAADADPVPVIPDPDRLSVVVAGNPGRNQSKYYIPLGHAGQRVTRRVAGAPG